MTKNSNFPAFTAAQNLPLDPSSPQIAGQQLFLRGPLPLHPLRRPRHLHHLPSPLPPAELTNPIPFRHFPQRRLQAPQMEPTQTIIALNHRRIPNLEADPALLRIRLLAVGLRPFPPLEVDIVSDLELAPVVDYLLVVDPLGFSRGKRFGNPRGRASGGFAQPGLGRGRGDRRWRVVGSDGEQLRFFGGGFGGFGFGEEAEGAAGSGGVVRIHFCGRGSD